MIIKEAKKIEIKINANPMNLDGIKKNYSSKFPASFKASTTLFLPLTS